MEYILDHQAIFDKRFFSVVALVLVYYDYILTFTREVNWMWSTRGFSVVPILFYANRYVALIGLPMLILRTFSSPLDGMNRDPPEVCSSVISVLLGLALISNPVFSILRTYALYGKSLRVLILLLVSGSTSLVAGLVFYFSSRSEEAGHVLVDNCFHRDSNKVALHTAIQYSFMLGFDIIVFILTLHKSMQQSKAEKSTPLLTILFRDGTIFFGVMSMSCAGIILCYMFASSAGRGQGIVLGASLSSLLMSRLILDIRDPSLQGHHVRPAVTSKGGEYPSEVGPFTTIIDTRQTDSDVLEDLADRQQRLLDQSSKV
ncbi:hypothetical protein FA15DRAFT_758891 [Coprinopsis marcescibilis]|uniref:DUF6533 domain-containing protein n=1 Tax=Coprinopsis marcescibilis TaxID=230819 RepID=A0A5C3KLQ0_COPMA|nr:hypothetical protein FA15DRAFT_758891 [Coprinopsis marcescibilis]